MVTNQTYVGKEHSIKHLKYAKYLTNRVTIKLILYSKSWWKFCRELVRPSSPSNEGLPHLWALYFKRVRLFCRSSLAILSTTLFLLERTSIIFCLWCLIMRDFLTPITSATKLAPKKAKTRWANETAWPPIKNRCRRFEESSDNLFVQMSSLLGIFKKYFLGVHDCHCDLAL